MIRGHRGLWLAGLLVTGIGPARASNWFETQSTVESLADGGDYGAAIELGDRLLSEVTDEFGESSRELAEAQLKVAALYLHENDFDGAELHLLRGIDTYEEAAGPVSPILIEPLVMLGDTYTAAGEFESALATYEEARTLGRREYGLLNLAQIDILDRMSNTALAMRDFDEAQALQQDAVIIVQRRYGDSSPEFLDASYRYGEWLTSHYEYREADTFYFSMRKIIDKNFDDDPHEQIRLLLARSANYRDSGGMLIQQHGTNPAEIEKALKIARRLDEPAPLLEASILRDLGDWYVSYGFGDADEVYAEAWDLLGQVENGDALRKEWFSPLKRVRTVPFRTLARSTREDAPWAHIELTFTLDPAGVPTDIRVRSSNPPGLFDDAAANQLRSSRYRPRMADGAPVPSLGAARWDFQYEPDLAQLRPAVRSGPSRGPGRGTSRGLGGGGGTSLGLAPGRNRY